MACRGELQAATSGRVTGWAWLPTYPGHRLGIEVSVDGVLVARGRAWTFDERLRLAGVGDGGHRFALDLPHELCDGAAHRLSVVVADCDVVLAPAPGFVGTSPAKDRWHGTSFTPVSDHQPRPEQDSARDGRLEAAVIDETVVGWAWDAGAWWRRVELLVLVDDLPVARTVADGWSPNLLGNDIGDGWHRFRVVLPARSSTLPESSVSVVFAHEHEKPPIHNTALAGKLNTPTPDAAQGHLRGPRGRRLRLGQCTQEDFPRSLDTSSLGEGSDPETIVLAEPTAVVRTAPIHLEVGPQVHDPAAEHATRGSVETASYISGSVAVSRLPGGLVDTDCYLLCPNDRHYLIDSIRARGGLRRWGYEIEPDGTLRRDVDTIIERPERVVVLGAMTNASYGHWLLESVARALLFRSLDDGTRMYLTPPLNAWQRSILEVAGVTPERILEIEPGGLVRFAEVVAVSRAIRSMVSFVPCAVGALANLAPAGGTERRLYLSRGHMSKRGITNEAEVSALLARHGFKEIHPQSVPFIDQLRLFAGAQALVGPHGSGLVNAIFCPPDTRVIELQPEGFDLAPATMYRQLTTVRDQPFGQLVCAADVSVPFGVRDMHADLDALERLLELTL